MRQNNAGTSANNCYLNHSRITLRKLIADLFYKLIQFFIINISNCTPI